MAFLPGKCTRPQLHSCHRLFDQDGHQDSSSPPYSVDLAPWDFWLFPKFRGCCYETFEEMKEAVTKVIDTLTQEDFHGAFQKLLERYNKCIAAGRDYFEGGQSFMRVLSINVPRKLQNTVIVGVIQFTLHLVVIPDFQLPKSSSHNTRASSKLI